MTLLKKSTFTLITLAIVLNIIMFMATRLILVTSLSEIQTIYKNETSQQVPVYESIIKVINHKRIKVEQYFTISIAIFSILMISFSIGILNLFVVKRIILIQKRKSSKEKNDEDMSILEGTDELSQLARRFEKINSKMEFMSNELYKNRQETAMAQITVDILKNAGNLLNKANLASNRVKVFIKNDDFNDLIRSIDMLLANRADPVKFFTEGKGELLLEYLNKISSNFSDHKRNAELYQKSLERGLEELKELFDTYQPYTENVLPAKRFPVNEALDEAIDSQYYGLNAEISLIKNYNCKEIIHCNKPLFIKLFSNLLKHAIETPRDHKNSEIKVITNKVSEKKIKISIIDNGLEIPKDLQTLIFNYKFSTKDPIQDLTLFNSVNYAVELNSRLYIEKTSKEGTTITVEIPLK